METRSQKKESCHLLNSKDMDPRSSALPSTLTPNAASMETDGENVIMKAITDMKKEFSANFTGILTAVQDLKSNFNDFTNRLTEAEKRIGDTEDNVSTLQKQVAELQKQVTSLTVKTEDQENCSRRNNLRLINLPEGVEGRDAVTFLERWLLDTFGSDCFPYPLFIEQAHHLQQSRQDRNFPRVLIMRFLNFKDKERVVRAARAKGKIMYNDQEVKFFQDVARETHIKRKRYDEVKQQLKARSIQYEILHPARLRVTHAGRSQIFNSPEEAAVFLLSLPND